MAKINNECKLVPAKAVTFRPCNLLHLLVFESWKTSFGRVVRHDNAKRLILVLAFVFSSPGRCKFKGGDTECPLQDCQLSRSSESTHFLRLRRDVALFDSTRAPDSFCDRRHVPAIYFLTFPTIKRQPYHTKPIQMISSEDSYGPFEAVS